jgi:hypothetical protein
MIRHLEEIFFSKALSMQGKNGRPMKTSNKNSHHYAQGYSHIIRKRRTKSDWAGISIGDGFKSNIDYYTKISAQRYFYRIVKQNQKNIARLISGQGGMDFQPKVKPQISPFYTTYPLNLAGHVAIGLTVFLEYKARAEQKSLFTHLKKYLENPAEYDDVGVDPEIYKSVVRIVTENVQNRLLLEDISRIAGMSSVELYRLFAASQQQCNFSSLQQIIQAVILYGDVLPDWHNLDLHPMTQSVLKVLTMTSGPYFSKLASVTGQKFTDIGIEWVRITCRQLSFFLPTPKEEQNEANIDMAIGYGEKNYSKPESWSYKRTNRPVDPDRISPLNGPNPPLLLEPENTMQALSSRTVGNQGDRGLHGNSKVAEKEEPSALHKSMESLSSAIEKAAGQKAGYEDIRSDLLEHALGSRAFNQGPIQGNPTEGHEVKIKLDGENIVGGEIFDRPVEFSGNDQGLEKLLDSSRLVTEALSRVLFPNIQQLPRMLRYRTSGAIDPARLALASFSSTVFKRYRNLTQLDKKGKAVLVIACDGSGSLNQDQMNMVKIMSSGFLNSTLRSDVQVLAGFYHSGLIRSGLTGPLVQWIYHPLKTPSVSRKDAVRSLVSLPDSGTGAQSDALSLAFILNEARQLARGSMIYMVVISDTAWNRSFNTEKGGFEEVCAFFETAQDETGKKLHTTLVALGKTVDTGLEHVLDKIITISNEELKNYSSVAEKIGVYVASCIRERKRFSSSR